MNTNQIQIPRKMLVGVAVVVVLVGGAAVFATMQTFSLMDQLDRSQAETHQLRQQHAADQKAQQTAQRKQPQPGGAGDAQWEDLWQQSAPEPGTADAGGATKLARVATGTNAVAAGDSGRGGGDRDGWFERLKLEDPERYKQMQEERDKRRKQMDDWYQAQMTTLTHRAQNPQSPEEAEVAAQLASTLARLREMHDQWRAVRELPDDQRRDAARQLEEETRALYKNMGQLRDADRQVQLNNLARSIGYTDPAAMNSFAETVRSIYKNTEYNPESGFSGRDRDRDRGGGGPPPR